MKPLTYGNRITNRYRTFNDHKSIWIKTKHLLYHSLNSGRIKEISLAIIICRSRYHHKISVLISHLRI